jgi:hypothetical protein
MADLASLGLSIDSKPAATAAGDLSKLSQAAKTAEAGAALAPPPLGLGPIAGAPVAASIQAWGAAQVGIIAATGLAQAFSSGKSGSPTTNRGGGGSASAPSNALPAGPQSAPQIIHINATGSRYTREELRDIVEGINEAMRDGTKLVFNPT